MSVITEDNLFDDRKVRVLQEVDTLYSVIIP